MIQVPAGPLSALGAELPSSVDTRSEIREFLTSRRARITPDQAGLRTYGDSTRRVPGLRREEVALLAGVSVDYYTRLERGNASGVSESVLEALARALQLDEAERAHLFDLARAAHRDDASAAARRSSASARACSASSTRSPPRRRSCATGAWTSSPPTGSAAPSTRSTSTARTARRTRRASSSSIRARQTSTPTGTRSPTDAVAILRSEAGRDPYDRGLSDLVGELSTRSETFRTRWAAHNVRFHDTGFKRFHHPVVGDLELDLRDDGARRRHGPDAVRLHRRGRLEVPEALNLLASWAATLDEVGRAR